MDTATRERYAKIANMLVMEVPQVQIAAACNITPARISQILEEDEFKEIYAAISAEELTKYKDLNDGWDHIESRAVGSLVEILEYNRNPDLLLRVAAVANKAQRRGSRNNAPIDPQKLGARVVINLQPMFVNRLEQGMSSVAGSIQARPVKQLDMMAPGQVEKLLNTDILGDFEIVHEEIEKQG